MTIPKLDLEHGFMSYITRNQIDRDNYHKDQLALKTTMSKNESNSNTSPWRKVRAEPKHPAKATYVPPGMRCTAGGEASLPTASSTQCNRKKVAQSEYEIENQTRRRSLDLGYYNTLPKTQERRNLDTEVPLKGIGELKRHLNRKQPTRVMYRPPKQEDGAPVVVVVKEKIIVTLLEDKDDEFIFVFNYHGHRSNIFQLHVYKETNCEKLSERFGSQIGLGAKDITHVANFLSSNRKSLLHSQDKLKESILDALY